MKNLFGISAALLGLLTLTAHSQAQTINWGAAQNMTGDADVVTNGAYYDAVTFNPTALTFGDVIFNSISTSGHSHSDGIITITNGDNTGQFGGTFSGGSVAYGDLTKVGTFGESGPNTDSVTIAGLTVGDLYQVESWSYWTGDGTATTTYSGSTPVSLTNATGQFAIGTFTATSATESYFYFTGGGHNFINAVSVEDLSGGAVPEPSQTLLLGLGFVSLAIYIRRKRLASL